MIAFFVRYSSMMRIFSPIAKEMRSRGVPYIVFLWKKEDNSAYAGSIENINKADPDFLKDVEIRKFNAKTINVKDISKIITVESRTFSEKTLAHIKKNGAEVYNILYFTEALTTNKASQITSMDRVYYPSKYIQQMLMKYYKIEKNNSRDRLFGLPFYENIVETASRKTNNSVIVLLPSFKTKDELIDAFNRKSNKFVRFVSLLSNRYDVILKTRNKIRTPARVRRCASDIMKEEATVNEVLQQSNNVIMFYSNGIYEYMLGGANAYNIPIVLPDKSGYFSPRSNALFNYKGAVKFINWNGMKRFDLDKKYFDQKKRQEWIEKFIGLKDYRNITKNIVEDILN